ncbi:MAG: DMT family transporter [Anaerolineae bacterium]|nr:DMT family transporter [Anaerolineae bacterium]
MTTPPEQVVVAAKPRVSPLLGLAVGVLAISTGSILVRIAQGENVPSLVIAAWRLTFAALILLPFCLARRRDELRSLNSADMRFAALSGMMLALHFATWITSLEYTSVAVSTVLVTTSPLWVALAAPFFLGERVTRPVKIGIGLALVGSVIISLGSFGGGSAPVWGSLLALLGAITAAAYLLIGRKLRVKLSLLTYVTLVYTIAALILIVLALAAGNNLLDYSAQTFFLFLLLALFPQLIGHSSFNWALGFLPVAYVTVAVISEPIGASILALLFFQEIPTPLTLLGSAFILGGLIVAGRKEIE